MAFLFSALLSFIPSFSRLLDVSSFWNAHWIICPLLVYIPFYGFALAWAPCLTLNHMCPILELPWGFSNTLVISPSFLPTQAVPFSRRMPVHHFSTQLTCISKPSSDLNTSLRPFLKALTWLGSHSSVSRSPCCILTTLNTLWMLYIYQQVMCLPVSPTHLWALWRWRPCLCSQF